MKHIELLAAEKSFDQPSESEKAQVLALMPAQRYTRLHELLRKAATLDANVEPTPELASRLQQRMMLRGSVLPQTPSPRLHRISRLRIPVWQTAAAVVIAFAIGNWTKTQTSMPPAKPDMVVKTEIRTDTIFVDRIRWKEKVVWRTPATASPVVSAAENFSGLAETPAATALPEPGSDFAAPGAPIGEQPELLQFFTQPGSR